MSAVHAATSAVDAILRRVQNEFLEMPGLRLTPEQATRLWGVNNETCRAVIESLVASAFLRWTSKGTVMLAD